MGRNLQVVRGLPRGELLEERRIVILLGRDPFLVVLEDRVDGLGSLVAHVGCGQ